MEAFFLFVIKLSIIFLGGGIVTLFATWVASQTSSIPGLILNFENNRSSKIRKLRLVKYKNINPESGFYEVSLPGGNMLNIFSSSKGMKIV